MTREFKNLSAGEFELIIKAPLLVSILIAGADGEMDRNEIKQAVLTLIKKAKGNNALKEYLNIVTEDFEDKLKVLSTGYSFDAQERGRQIATELAGLNAVFKKIDLPLAKEIHSSLKTLAVNIAKSSGGFWGINSVGSEEAEYLDLDMINPPS